MWVPTTVLLVAMMQRCLQGADTINVLGQCSLGLLRAPFAPTRDSNFSQLTEANYDGYVRINNALPWPPVIGQGNLVLAVNEQQWNMSGSASPNTIYGHFLAYGNSASPTLGAVEIFDQPVPMTGPFSFIAETTMFGMDPGGNYGKSSISF